MDSSIGQSDMSDQEVIGKSRWSVKLTTFQCDGDDDKGDDKDDDGDDGDLYIMGAVCLCVCYVFSYFNFLRWENTL